MSNLCTALECACSISSQVPDSERFATSISRRTEVRTLGAAPAQSMRLLLLVVAGCSCKSPHRCQRVTTGRQVTPLLPMCHIGPASRPTAANVSQRACRSPHCSQRVTSALQVAPTAANVSQRTCRHLWKQWLDTTRALQSIVSSHMPLPAIL